MSLIVNGAAMFIFTGLPIGLAGVGSIITGIALKALKWGSTENAKIFVVTGLVLLSYVAITGIAFAIFHFSGKSSN